MTPQLLEEIAEYDRMTAINTALHDGRAKHLLKRTHPISALRKRIVDSPDWAVSEKNCLLTKSPAHSGRYAWIPRPITRDEEIAA